MLRALLTARSAAAADAARAALGMGQDEAYRNFSGRCGARRSAAARSGCSARPIRSRRCARDAAVGSTALRPGSVVTLGGGWKSFEATASTGRPCAR